jgi:hypothetical protein
MPREDVFQPRDDEPTRPVHVPRLSTTILNDTSRAIPIEPDATPGPQGEDTPRPMR